MIDFLIFYELKNREMESIVLLGEELVKRGFLVDYVSFFEIHNVKTRRKFHNKVRYAIMPSLYHEQEVIDIVYYIAGKVEQIIDICWEQIYTNYAESNINYYCYPKGIAKFALFCSWGEKYKKLLLKAGVNEGRIVVTGPLHLDFLRNNFKEYYDKKNILCSRYNIDLHKPLLMFVSSFSISSFTEKEIENYLLEYKDKHEKQIIITHIENEKRSRAIIVKWIIEFCENNDCTFIYRPHPAEVKSVEVEKLKKCKNIEVIDAENIKQWITCCDQIYTWYSTSAIEMYFANKHFEILRPVDLPYEDDLPIYQGAEFVKFQSEFERLAKGVVYSKNKPCLNNDIVRSYYDVTDITSVRRMVDFLLTLDSYDSYPWNEIAGKIRFRYIQLSIIDSLKEYKNNCLDIISKIPILPNTIKVAVNNKLNSKRIVTENNSKNIISEKEMEDIKKKINKYI